MIELNRDKIQLFLNVITSYLERRGEILLSLTSATEQTRLKIEFHGLMREYSRIVKDSLFIDLVREIMSDQKLVNELKNYGIIEIRMVDNDGYIVLDLAIAREKLFPRN